MDHYWFSHELRKIMDAIIASSIEIESILRLSAFEGGTTDMTNSSGDNQKPLDILSNDIMIKNLSETKCCSYLLSEENLNEIKILDGNYMVAFDPLDGSSNIDCNVCVGTIFSIYQPSSSSTILRPASEIEVAGYILYGPSTELVMTWRRNESVQHFTLNPVTKKFIYKQEVNLLGKNKKIYSINEGNASNWYQDIESYIHTSYKTGYYTQRYIGSMVADVHRTFMYGGMFAYPADKKNPMGKLRLVYECFPMAVLVEAANGKAIVGHFSRQNILDVQPNSLHERTPILLGTADEIEKYNPEIR